MYMAVRSGHIRREKVSTASGIDVAGSGTVVPFRDSVKLLGDWSYTGFNVDDGPARHTSCMQLQLSHTCTATHQATADTRRRQDACPQHRVIAAGLRQRTATRHVGQEPRQVAGGTELTSQGSLSGPPFCKCH